MINTRIFCPFERIASIVYVHAASNGVKAFEIDFGFYGKRTIAIDEIGPNRALGFTEAQRLDFMNQDEVAFNVRYIKSDGDSVVRKGKCINSLMTDRPVVKSYSFNGAKGLTNGFDAAQKPIAYPEAAKFYSTLGVVKFDETLQASHLMRPFYCYLKSTVKDSKDMLILGPANMKKFRSIGAIDVDGNQYRLFDKNDIILENDVELLEPLSVSDKPRLTPRVILRCGGEDTPFIFTQKAVMIDGRRLSYVSMLQILKAVCLFEILTKTNQDTTIFKDISENNSLVISVELINNEYHVDSIFTKFYRKYVEQNEFITNLFSRLSATDDAILIQDREGNFGRITSTSSNSACFSLSLAYYLSFVGSNTYIDIIKSLTWCLNSSGLTRASKGSIVGNTATALATEKELQIPTINGVIKRNLKRRDVDFSDDKQELCLFGYDDDPANNLAPGEPDHWVFALRCGKHVEVLYDPYRLDGKNYAIGSDLSTLVGSKDSLCITLGV